VCRNADVRGWPDWVDTGPIAILNVSGGEQRLEIEVSNGLRYFTRLVGEYDNGMANPSYVELTDASH